MQKKKQVHLGPQFSINQSINSCLNHHFSRGTTNCHLTNCGWLIPTSSPTLTLQMLLVLSCCITYPHDIPMWDGSPFAPIANSEHPYPSVKKSPVPEAQASLADASPQVGGKKVGFIRGKMEKSDGIKCGWFMGCTRIFWVNFSELRYPFKNMKLPGIMN